MTLLRPATMLAFAGLALCAAATDAAEIKVNYDRQADFTRYKTWSWRKGTPATNPAADKLLRDAIESRLAARGFSRVESRGDLEVVYHAAAENKIALENLGYKQPDFEGQATRVRYLTVGTVLLDMIDASTGKVVWRGEARDATTPTARAIERMIDEGIAQLLQDFPPEDGTADAVGARGRLRGFASADEGSPTARLARPESPAPGTAPTIVRVQRRRSELHEA
jgi:hypothetical protein